jgi:ribose transport system permease protein
VLRILGAFLSLILLILLFGFLAPLYDQQFLWPPQAFLENFRTIAAQTVIVSLGAIGMTVVIASAGIDLSVGSVVALSMVVSSLAFNLWDSSLPAALAGIATGALCGLLNGAMITGFRIVPFIATLGMMGLARGAAKLLARSTMVNPGYDAWKVSWLRPLMTTRPPASWLLVAPGVWILLGLAGFMSLVLRNTVFGRHVFAIGSNEATARLCGIRVRSMKVGIYSLAGGFSGLAGVMFFSRQAQGDPTAAPGLELDVIAAVVIGGGSLNGGEGSILGSLIGAFIMAVLRHGLVKIDVSNPVQEILIGAIIIAAVVVDQLRQRRRD